MQMVIDISEKIYNALIHTEFDANLVVDEMRKSIANGTPLPKGHGRLIDADEILKAMNTWDKFGYTETGCFVREPKNDYISYVHYEDMVKAVSGTPTIIPADKSESER